MSACDRQGDIVQRHRDVAGQDVHECALVPYRIPAGDDVAGKLPAQGRLLHRSQKPGGLWYGYMLGDWSTRYLPGGMLAVAQPSVGCLPKTPLLP